MRGKRGALLDCKEQSCDRMVMPTVDLDQGTYDQLSLAASVAGITVSEAVGRLIKQHRVKADTRTTFPIQHKDLIPIHAKYQKRSINALFNPLTSSVSITSSPWNNKQFPTPSTAARAVVAHLSPSVHTNRNGWTFWRINATNKALDSLRL